MILGIASTTMHSYIIRLEFIDDTLEPPVKTIDMKVGLKYHVSYVGTDGTVYELVGILDAIKEVSPPAENEVFVREKKREEVGFDNSVYDSSKSDFFTLTKHMKNDVVFTFDCSERFTTYLDKVYLSTIRDVEIVKGPTV